MSTRSRRLASILSLALVVLVAACGSAEQSVDPSPPAGRARRPAAQPHRAIQALQPMGRPRSRRPTPTWGRIWDDVPPGFPTFAGSTIAGDTSPEPVSATYSVANDDTAVIATWMQAALENASFRTEALSGPLEDGSFVLDWLVRASAGCRSCRPDGRIDLRDRPLRVRLPGRLKRSGSASRCHHLVRKCDVPGAFARHMSTFTRLCWQWIGRESDPGSLGEPKCNRRSHEMSAP